MLNNSLKQKLSEVLPRLQLDLIDDFRRGEGADSPHASPPPPPLQASSMSASTHQLPDDFSQNMAAQHKIPQQHGGSHPPFDMENLNLPLEFLGSLDWGLLPDPDFDIAIGMPGSFHNNENYINAFDHDGSLATQDLESTEEGEVEEESGVCAIMRGRTGKTRDSGYASLSSLSLDRVREFEG